MVTPVPHYPRPAAIEAYGNGGFRFAGMSHKGSILCLPDGIHGWAVQAHGDVTLASMGPLLEPANKVPILLFGMGRVLAAPSPELRRTLAEAGIQLEPMDTGAAARTYNILLAEGRPIAAALIAVE
jgi:uncharacterized protein